MLSSPVSSSNTDEIIIMFPSRKSPDREDFTNRRKRCRTCETSWSGHLWADTNGWWPQKIGWWADLYMQVCHHGFPELFSSQSSRFVSISHKSSTGPNWPIKPGPLLSVSWWVGVESEKNYRVPGSCRVSRRPRFAAKHLDLETMHAIDTPTPPVYLLNSGFLFFRIWLWREKVSLARASDLNQQKYNYQMLNVPFFAPFFHILHI